MEKIKYRIFVLLAGVISTIYLGQPAEGQTDLPVVPNDTVKNMGEEILHTPYVNVKRKFYSGSISTLKGSDVANNPILYRTNSMTGMLGGISVNERTGIPGFEYADVYLRGLSINTLLIDGVLVDPNNLNAMGPMDPYDIESISVLKDAMATSEFGMRGGTGIINITTKRGFEGRPEVNVNMQTGFKKQTVGFEPVNSYQYVTAVNLWDHNLGKTPDKYTYQPDVVAKYREICENGYDDINNPLDRYLYPNNNYADMFLKPSTFQSRINMNIRGGNKIAKYFLSTNYIYNDGMFNVDNERNTYNTNTFYNFFGIRSNVDIQATKSLVVSLDITAQQERRNFPGGQTGSGAGGIVGGEYQPANATIYAAIIMTPPNAYPVFNPDGSLSYSNLGNYRNIYGLLNDQGYSFDLTRSMLGHLTLKQDLGKITKGLVISGSAYFSNRFVMTVKRNKEFQGYKIDLSSIGSNNLDSLKYIAENVSKTVMASGAPTWGQTYSILNFDLGADYSRQFGRHEINAHARFSNQTIDYNTTYLPRVFRGVRGGVSYVYNQRYVIEGNYCLEATERLPGNKKWVPFYAYGASWIASNEEFIKRVKMISFLKLSYSGGIAGSDNIPYFQFLPQFATGTSWLRLGYNPTTYPEYREVSMPASNIVPEKYSTNNIRLDLALFENHFTTSLDLWSRRHYDIRIQALDVPNTVGSAFPLVPEGVTKYKGFELEVGYNNTIGGLKYSISALMNDFVSKVVKTDQSLQPYDYLLAPGLPVDANWGYILMGYFKDQQDIDLWPTYAIGTPKPGDFKVKDINGDGIINSYDQVYKGRNESVPEIQYGIHASLNFNNFDLSILFQGQDGGAARRTHLNWGFTEFSEGGLGTIYQHQLNSFVPDDPTTWANATWPLLYGDNPISRVFQSDYSQVKFNYLRLKTAEIGYSLPKKIVEKMNIQRLRFYFSGFNLISWQTAFWGFDIESLSDGRNVPIQKIYNFGINATF